MLSLLSKILRCLARHASARHHVIRLIFIAEPTPSKTVRLFLRGRALNHCPLHNLTDVTLVGVGFFTPMNVVGFKLERLKLATPPTPLNCDRATLGETCWCEALGMGALRHGHIYHPSLHLRRDGV